MSSDPQLRFDLKNFQVLLAGRTLELRPQCLDLLKHMAERPGQVLSKQALMDAVWHDKVVTEASLSQAIKQLRTAIGDDAQSPRYIETVHRRGYRFIGHSNLHGEKRATPNLHKQLAALVGRERELAQLDELYENARSGRRQLCFVAGEAGIGKTSLLKAFTERLHSLPEGDGCVIARGQCIEQVGGGEPYLPILDALQRMALSDRGDLVADLLRRWAPSWLVQMPWLLPEGQTYDAEILAITRVRMLREFCLFMEALSREIPVVIYLEDLHWGDHSTVELMDAFCRREEQANVLWLATFRPVDAALNEAPVLSLSRSAPMQDGVHTLELDPLGRAAVYDYLANRFPGLECLDDLSSMCSDLTDGNPLYVVAHSDFMVANGFLSEEDGRWVIHDELNKIRSRSPESLRAIITQRLEQIGRDEKSLLEVAAVLGVEFSGIALEGILGIDSDELDSVLSLLLEGGEFIRTSGQSDWPDGSSGNLYRFSHDIYRWVLYEGLTPSRRQRLHIECAAALRAGHEGKEADIAAELADHYEIGRDSSQAIDCLKMAAERAQLRAAHDAAIAYYDRALNLVSGIPRGENAKLVELDIHLRRAWLFIAATMYTADGLENSLRCALELSREQGLRDRERLALAQLSSCLFFRGDLSGAEQLLAQPHEISDDSTEPALLSYEIFMAAICALARGDLDDAETYYQRCIDLADRIDLRAPARVLGSDHIVMAFGTAGICAWLLGRPEEAKRRTALGSQRAEVVSVPSALVLAMDLTLNINCLCGDLSGAETTLADLDQLIKKNFGEYSYPRLLASRSWLLRQSGDIDGAISAMLAGIEKVKLNNAGAFVGLMYNNLAEAYLASGDVDEALLATGEALEAATRGQRIFEAESWRLRGEALAKRSETNEAIDCFVKAQAVAREQAALSLELRAMISQLELLRDDPGSADIRARMAAIVDQCEHGDSDATQRRARKLLQDG